MWRDDRISKEEKFLYACPHRVSSLIHPIDLIEFLEKERKKIIWHIPVIIIWQIIQISYTSIDKFYDFIY